VRPPRHRQPCRIAHVRVHSNCSEEGSLGCRSFPADSQPSQSYYASSRLLFARLSSSRQSCHCVQYGLGPPVPVRCILLCGLTCLVFPEQHMGEVAWKMCWTVLLCVDSSCALSTHIFPVCLCPVTFYTFRPAAVGSGVLSHVLHGDKTLSVRQASITRKRERMGKMSEGHWGFYMRLLP
jgi:hypothetical protein